MEDLLRPRIVASRLLRWWRERAPKSASIATPIDELVAALGLEVTTFAPELHPGTLGFLEPGEDLVFLRAGLGEAVRRFTLAHELGHAVLHRSTGTAATLASQLTGSANPETILDSCNVDDLEAPLDLAGLSDETLRPGQAYSARARRESEANAFAAALLLPVDQLRAVYLAGLERAPRGVRPAMSARGLAERFSVSEDAVLRRLSALLTPGYEQVERAPEVGIATQGASTGRGAGLEALDEDQLAAARSATPALIVAGPGTGKTSTLVARVAHLVREEGVAPSSILALTFSNKAAREMRERLALLLAADSTLDDPNMPPPPIALPQVGTIHAFCGELLRAYGPYVGLRPDFRLVAQTEGYFLLRRLSAALDLNHYQPLGAPAMYFPDLLAAISRAKDELVDPARYTELADAMRAAARTPEQREAAARAQEVAQVYSAYQQALAARGDPDFGDVVRLAVQLLQEQPDVLAEVRSRYSHLLVDEFQDINRAMGVLLQTLSGAQGPLWAVGDPDQAIYRFRGASPANIARFGSEYSGSHVHRLGRNYRSYRPILDAAHAVAEAFIPGPQRPNLRSTRGKGTTSDRRLVTLATAPDDGAELAGLVAAIREQQSAGKALLDQAVLCRTRRGAQRVVAALQVEGIPTRVVAPLLEQDDVKDLLAVVSLLAESSGAGLLRAGTLVDHAFAQADARRLLEAAREAHVSPLALLSPASLAQLDGLGADGRAGLAHLGELLPALRSAPDVATGLSRYAFSLTNLGARLLAGEADGDPVLAERAHHLARLLALAHAFEDQQRAAALTEEVAVEAESDDEEQENTTTRAKRTGAAWSDFLEYVRVLTVLRQEVGGADDALVGANDGIWVLTVHASKGLEFPVVYLPALSERRFPVQRQYVAAPPPSGLLIHDGGPEDEAHLAEEACLFYVALTRARDELVLSVADRYGRVKAKPSRFLRPIEDRLDKELRRVRWSSPERASPSPHLHTEGPRPQPSATRVPLNVAELETYQRCPRQYAYAYVYGLRAQGGGLGLLNRSVREALQALRGEIGDTKTYATLADARRLFDEAWDAARGGTANEPAGPYEGVYRRYGQLIVERAWQSMTKRQKADSVQEQHGQDAKAALAIQELDRELTVQIGGREVTLPVDRVEREGSGAGAVASNGNGHVGSARTNGASLRLVRHRLTQAGRPDLRTLLYTLAAEERARSGEAVEVVQEHLPTGTSAPIELSVRQRTSLREALEDVMDGINSQHYPPRQDPHTCQGCPFLLICPA